MPGTSRQQTHLKRSSGLVVGITQRGGWRALPLALAQLVLRHICCLRCCWLVLCCCAIAMRAWLCRHLLTRFLQLLVLLACLLLHRLFINLLLLGLASCSLCRVSSSVHVCRLVGCRRRLLGFLGPACDKGTALCSTSRAGALGMLRQYRGLQLQLPSTDRHILSSAHTAHFAPWPRASGGKAALRLTFLMAGDTALMVRLGASAAWIVPI